MLIIQYIFNIINVDNSCAKKKNQAVLKEQLFNKSALTHSRDRDFILVESRECLMNLEKRSGRSIEPRLAGALVGALPATGPECPEASWPAAVAGDGLPP